MSIILGFMTGWFLCCMLIDFQREDHDALLKDTITMIICLAGSAYI